MSSDTTPKRRVSVFEDERGRIPFAIIALLLLVASVGTIATLEQRSDPTIERDGDLLLDRTTTAAQSELRTAVLDATHKAGAAPINTTDGSQVHSISSANDQRGAFRNYVKLLVYLEAEERLPAAGQTVGGDARSTVTVPPVAEHPGDDQLGPDEAIERVDLDVGYFDEDVERGTIRATIQGVEFDGSVGGEAIPTETRSVRAVVGSPVFELNEKMTEYERQLNKGFLEGDEPPDPTNVDGLGQELAVRLYPMAYLKAGWNRMDQPTNVPDDQDFEEVVGTDHSELFANHAIFSVQEDVFGTRDPYADRAMRPQYLCTSIDVGTTISDVDPEVSMDDVFGTDNITFSADIEDHLNQGDEIADSVANNETIDNVTIGSNPSVNFQEQVCGDGGYVNDWVFGDEATGELPDVPPLSELLQSGVDGMNVADQEINVPVESLARATVIEYHVEQYEVDGVGAYDDPEAYLDAIATDIVGQMEAEGIATDDAFVGGAPDDGGEYDRSPSDLIDRLYEVDISTTTDATVDSVRTPQSPGSEYRRDPGNDSNAVVDIEAHSVDHTPIPEGEAYDRPIHEVEATASVDVERTRGWEARNKTITDPNYTTTSVNDTPVVDVGVTIEGAYGFDGGGEYYTFPEEFGVPADPIETDYGPHAGATFRDAFRDSLVEATAAEGYTTAETDLASALETALSGSDASRSDLERAAENALEAESSLTFESEELLSPGERADLESAMVAELEAVHEDVLAAWAADPFTVELSELTDDATPPAKVIEHLQREYEAQYVGGGPYETPEDVANAQMRKAYFDRLYYWLDEFDDEYDDQMGSVNDQIDEVGEGAGMDHLDDALSYVQGFANADFEPDPEPLEGSRVLDEAQYEVSGSPTYMTTTEITREQDPAIRPVESGIRDLDSDVHHHPMSVQTHNRVPWPGLPLIFYTPGNWYATINFWSVDVNGEYARLEVSSTVGDPADSDRLTYVAEHRPVSVELSDGSAVAVGKNEAVDFETSTEVIIIMPGAVVQKGGPIPAVADGSESRFGTTYCSDTWEEVGPNAPSDTSECR